ncbi:lytic polysaccharide monooxygenase [Streptomyces sp. N2-109]|uniref:Lytic polysaccharide monooxygenase n=1 Tax=Streptomyces gossypii TaxID=2883101 RepID=A0ABT2K0S1_9ACTN|nr:lytic polysaccharide monooxygenase [Streptomyces gossypii]MCT2592968.1 lytic polysaccharide monooxygenase [Streptomyces gossypii]MCT2593701.1 lytic polysaccharide monooxygenase [Streptomyces gossypii]
MNTKRRLAVMIGAGIAPLLAVTLPTGTASAHGYVNSPPSRQAQCAAGTVDCGQIKYEPHSVEGPKGLKSCSGGNSRFAELDDDSKGWKATPVDSSTTFTWKLTARHATSTWQYFVGGQKVAEFNDGGAQPPATVNHQVDFGNLTGKQKVLAVWNVADTDNAFYSCIDVNIGGDPGGPGEPGDPDDCTATAWDAGSVYNGGDTVTWGDHTWRARWWVQGQEPGSSGEWGVWEDLGACAPA